MEPLAVHREARFEGPRQYSVFQDHLLISGRETFRSDFEMKVPLANLHPEYSRARVRNRLFWFGLLLIVVGGLGVMERLSTPRGLSYEDFWAILWVAVLIAGVIVCGATWRMTSHLIFVDQSGRGVVGLVERDDSQFRAFVQALSNQIEVCKRESMTH